MPQITQIKAQKNQKRVNIYLDEKFSFGLDLDNFVKAGLKVGQQLSEKEIEELAYKNVFQKLYDKALRLISRRPRSEKEIRLALSKTSNLLYPDPERSRRADLSDWVIARLREKNFLNDEEFAHWLVEQRSTFRPRGQRALLFELRQKGISKEIAEKIVTENVDEFSLAKNLIQKKFPNFLYPERSRRANHPNPPNHSDRQRLSAYLSRRGFSWGTIERALDEIREKE